MSTTIKGNTSIGGGGSDKSGQLITLSSTTSSINGNDKSRKTSTALSISNKGTGTAKSTKNLSIKNEGSEGASKNNQLTKSEKSTESTQLSTQSERKTESTQLDTKSERNTESSTQLSTKGSDGKGSIESGKSKQSKGTTEIATTWCEIYRLWPYHTFLIVVMELAIALTGLSTVMNLYYINVCEFTPEMTTNILSATGIIGGFAKVLGSGISDSYLGKFKAILFGTCIYIVGKLVLTTSTFLPRGSPHPYLDFSAILIITIGTSFMHPSIAPFGGDQFQPHQAKMISLYYSLFYASFNIGPAVSNLVMPKLRATPCLGKDSCYPLSFTVSTVGVVVSFVFFIVGSKCYTKSPPSGNIFKAVYHVVKTTQVNRKKSEKEKDHWLEYYFDTHVCVEDIKCLELRKKEGDAQLCHKKQFIDDFKCLLRLLVVFIPLPMFWALFFQQDTVWINQALLLDLRLWGNTRILPDQMKFVNPVLIIVLIILFQFVIYPLFGCIVRLTPLRKMVAGMFIAALAFLVSGVVQLRINLTLPDIPPDGYGFVSVVNTYNNCSFNISNTEETKFLSANSSLINDKLLELNQLFKVKLNEKTTWNIEWQNCNNRTDQQVSFTVKEPMSIITIAPTGAFLSWADTNKPTGGTGQFKIGILLAKNETYNKNLAFCRKVDGNSKCNQHAGADFYMFVDKKGKVDHQNIRSSTNDLNATMYPYIEVLPGTWQLYYLKNNPEEVLKEELNVEAVEGIEFSMEDQGGIYTLIVSADKNGKLMKTVHQVVPPNSVSIYWQLPQIFVISVAEILFSVTGNEFVYSQSGPSMKAVANAFWSLTMSLGYVIIIIVNELPLENLAIKAFICAGLMVLDVILFTFLAMFKYEYREGTNTTEKEVITESMEESKEMESVKFTRKSVRSNPGSTKYEQPKIAYVYEAGTETGGTHFE